MTVNTVSKIIYVGNEFPEYYGFEIIVKDDNSNPNNPCYKIQFVGENIWHENMGDEDFKIELDNIPGQFFASGEENAEGEAICANCGNSIAVHKSITCPKKLITEPKKANRKYWRRKR